MRTFLKILLPILVIAAGVAGAFTLIDSRPEVPTSSRQILPPLVRTLEAEARNLQLSVTTQGTVEAHTETSIVPEVSGRVVYVSPSLAEGGFFGKDEVLLRIDPRDYELAAVRAESQIAQVKLRLEQQRAEAEVARKEWEELGKGDPPSPLVLRRPQLEEAEASLAAAQAGLEEAQRNLARTEIRAPYDGRVRSETVDVGQFIVQGSPIAQVYAIDYAEVALPVADGDLAYLENIPLDYRDSQSRSPGPTVILRSEFAGETYSWKGQIVRTAGEIDRNSRMVYLIARVDDPFGRNRSGRPPLAVGMFVEAEIMGRWARDVVVLPRSAIRGEDTVYVVGEDNTLDFRQVSILMNELDQAVVDSGLTPGERVCLSPLEVPVEGMKVRVNSDDPVGKPVGEAPFQASERGK